MAGPYEGSLRLPFLVRWPAQIPANRVSNEIMHAVDLFATLASWTGGTIPKERTIDGVDQSALLMGQSETSTRDSVMIYIGNELFGVKWRNRKLLLKGMDENHMVKTSPYPANDDLIVDPKEEESSLKRTEDNPHTRTLCQNPACMAYSYRCGTRDHHYCGEFF